MKLILDQGLPRSTVKHLAAAGIAAQHVGDLGMAAATDAAILAFAQKHEAVVATLDADFHQLLALSGQRSPSVIRIRIEGLKGDQIAATLIQVIATTGNELDAGAVVSVNVTRIRVRYLPIGNQRSAGP